MKTSLPHVNSDGYSVSFKHEGELGGVGELFVVHKPTHDAWLEANARKIDGPYGVSWAIPFDVEPEGFEHTYGVMYAEALRIAAAYGVELGEA